MIRSTTLRIIAVLAISAQLSQVPLGIACAAKHAQGGEEHCGQMAKMGHRIDLRLPHRTVSGLGCTLMTGCALQPAAVAASNTFRSLAPEVAVRGSVRLAPSKFSPQPLSPPPQA